MGLSTEESQELKESYSLLGADELRAQLGESPEHDAIINSILADGKAVEMKTKPVVVDDGEELDPEGHAVKKPDTGTDDDDDDDDDTDPNKQPAVKQPGDKADTDPANPNPDDVVVDDPANTPDPSAWEAEAAALKLDLSPLDAKYRADLKALDSEKGTKFKAMMDGSITPEEYAEYESNYMQKRDDLRDVKANNAEWLTTVHNFKVDTLKASGINYQTDAEKGQAWDDWVKRLAAKPENAEKPAEWFLQEAHKKVLMEFGQPAPAAPAQKSGKNPAGNVAPAKKDAKSQGRAPNLAEIPPTIGALPAAASSEAADGGEFAHLENLTGMEFERALARLTPEQKARYEVA